VLYVPARYDGATPVPLLLLYHGYDSSPERLAENLGIGHVADDAGMLIAVPEGVGGSKSWNTRAFTGRDDDVAFARTLLDAVGRDLCYDSDQVYAAGFSMGGGMAMRAACGLPDAIAAVGTVGATYSDCRAPVPLIAFHGDADTVVPYGGGTEPEELSGGMFPPVRRTISEWARDLGCDGLATISRYSPQVEVSTYPNCPSGRDDVLLYTVLGGGHTWPGASPEANPVGGLTTQEIDATKTMIEFFAAHARDAEPAEIATPE
jgi:polyhydroxybutyrate depolymerase